MSWVVLVTLASTPYLDESRSLMEALKFDAAIEKLEWAQKSTTNTESERREVHMLLARAWAAKGRVDQAQKVFTELLLVDPEAPEPDDAPRIRKAFASAKESLYPKNQARLVNRASVAWPIDLEVFDPWALSAGVRLFVSKGEEPFAAQVLKPTARRVRLPSAQSGRVRWYAQLLGRDEAVLVSVGSAEQPNVFGDEPTAVRLQAQRPRWVPWVLCAGAAVGAVASAVLGLTSAASWRAANDAQASAEVGQDLLARSRREAAAAYVTGGVAIVSGVVGVLLSFSW
jgi:tetratricopeptide (TPR) repeat protein